MLTGSDGCRTVAMWTHTPKGGGLGVWRVTVVDCPGYTNLWERREEAPREETEMRRSRQIVVVSQSSVQRARWEGWPPLHGSFFTRQYPL